MLCDFSMLVITLYKIGEVHFRFLGTSGLRVKAKNERFTMLRASNMKHFDVVTWQTTSKWLHWKAPVPHVQHGYFSSFNQSNQWFETLSLPLQSSFLNLPIKGRETTASQSASALRNYISLYQVHPKFDSWLNHEQFFWWEGWYIWTQPPVRASM